MTVKVVDASAAVTLLLDPGPSGERVAELLRGASLAAPDHLPVEVLNVVRRLRHAGHLTESEARLAIGGLDVLPVELWPLRPFVERVWELGPDASAYDAAYVALAEHLDAALVTGDARLGRVPGIRCRVELA